MTKKGSTDPASARILMVCTGNICRSPMAHWMLSSYLRDCGCDRVVVESAGTWATMGFPATAEAVDVLTRRGIELDEHRSRALDPKAVRDADLVVAMTSVHVRELTALDPEVNAKLRLLKELAELAAWVRENARPDPASGLRDALRSLLEAPRPEARRALDLDDPIGLPVSAYERCAGEIELGIRALADVLCTACVGRA